MSAGNLTKSTTTLDTRDPDFFKIPLGRFEGIPVPGNGGHRSFYIATVNPGLIYSDPVGGKLVNEEMDLVDSTDVAHAPKILVGEGLAEYPMPKSRWSYFAKSFVGEVYYEKTCRSEAPSASGNFSARARANDFSARSPSSPSPSSSPRFSPPKEGRPPRRSLRPRAPPRGRALRRPGGRPRSPARLPPPASRRSSTNRLRGDC